MPLKHVLSVMGHVNLQNPKTVGNSSQKRPETQKRRVLVMPLKHVLSVIGHVNRLETPKLWAIAHENDHKR
jgi:hypothetical protein